MGQGTALGRVRALGSAHEGTHHWLLQRFTAAGNLLAQPLPALAIALMVVSVFWHARLGLQVMIEDYVHGASRFAAILLLNLAAFAGAGAGLLFVAQVVMATAGERAAKEAMASAMAAAAANQGGPR